MISSWRISRVLMPCFLLITHLLAVHCEFHASTDTITVNVAIPKTQIKFDIDNKLAGMNEQLKEYRQMFEEFRDQVFSTENIQEVSGDGNRISVNERLATLEDQIRRLHNDMELIKPLMKTRGRKMTPNVESENMFERLKKYIDDRFSAYAYKLAAVNANSVGGTAGNKKDNRNNVTKQTDDIRVTPHDEQEPNIASNVLDGSRIDYNIQTTDALDGFVASFKKELDNTASGDGLQFSGKQPTPGYTAFPQQGNSEASSVPITNTVNKFTNRLERVETTLVRLKNATSILDYAIKNSECSCSEKYQELHDKLHAAWNKQINITSRLSALDKRVDGLSNRVNDVYERNNGYYNNNNESLMEVLKIGLENQNNIELIHSQQKRLRRNFSITNTLVTSLLNTLEFVDSKVHRVSTNCNHWVKYFNETINTRSFLEGRMKAIEGKYNRLDDIDAFRKSYKNIVMDIGRIKKDITAHNILITAIQANSSSKEVEIHVKENSKRLDLLEVLRKIEDGGWGKYNFTYKTGFSGCSGDRYIRRTGYRSGKYVGAILCSSTKYKLTLGDRVDGEFLDIGDEESMGEDHCEFAGAIYNPAMLHRIKTNVSLLLAAGRKGYLRRRWKEEPRIGWMSFITPSPDWYKCGVSIP